MKRAIVVACLCAACGSAGSTSTAPSPSTSTSTSAPSPSAPSPSTAPSTAPSSPTAPSTAPGPSPSAATSLVAHLSSPPLLDGVLDDPAWRAPPTAITTDWSGATVAAPETLVRLAWAEDALFVAFDAAFEPPLTAPDEAADIEAEHLYGYDVVEVFVDADPSTADTYREIELGPRGHVLDVAVDLAARPRGDTSWSSGVTHAAHVDEAGHRFVVEARIPAAALGLASLAPSQLRIGLYRITAHAPRPRMFLARFPTLTPRPNFHVPARFGMLTLAP